MNSRIVTPFDVFLAACAILSLASDWPLGVLLAVVVAAVYHFSRGYSRDSKSGIESPPASLDVEDPARSADSKDCDERPIRCAFCNGSGTIIRDRLTVGGRVVSQQDDACEVCKGRGEVLTRLWNAPKCKRCNGSGKLVDFGNEPIVVGRKKILRRPMTTYNVCDVCGGIGKRPALVSRDV